VLNTTTFDASMVVFGYRTTRLMTRRGTRTLNMASFSGVGFPALLPLSSSGSSALNAAPFGQNSMIRVTMLGTGFPTSYSMEFRGSSLPNMPNK
jgi:hypothetical protein